MLYPSAHKQVSPFAGKVGDLIRGEIISIPKGSSINKAVERMIEARVSSLLILEGDAPAGFITKTDLVKRVMARGINPDSPIDDVMSSKIVSIQANSTIFYSLFLMIKNQIGHLLVMRGEKMVGVVSERDCLNYQEIHPAAAIKDIEKAESYQELRAIREKSNVLVRQLFGEDGTALSHTELVTDINDRVTRRVIELILKKTGEKPPVAFSWVAMGSEGRQEQVISHNQNNGIVFDHVEEENREKVREWFLGFAEKVVTGLEECGFSRRDDNIMANNQDFCLTASEWKQHFQKLIGNSNPEELLKASVHFDLRYLYGDKALVDAVLEDMRNKIDRNKGFIQFLAGKAKFFMVLPVNTFAWKLRKFIGIKHPPIDIKRQAIQPLVRYARMASMGCGFTENHTLKRLEEAREKGVLPNELVDSLRSAYDFLIMFRLRNYFRKKARQQIQDDIIRFEHVSRLEGRFLEEALNTIGELEDFVKEYFGSVESI